jgi:hypothetical protein
MHRPRPGTKVLLAASLAVLSIVAACSSGAEQPILSEFFTASRLRDNTSLGNFSMVSLDPRTEGTVTTFTIVNVSPEQRRPLAVKALAKAQDEAKAQDAEFTKRKEAYQNDHLEAIRRVLQAERESSRLKGQDAEVQVAWTKYRSESIDSTKKVSEARNKLASETSVAALSVYNPRRPVDLQKYDGEIATKDVTVAAPVKKPDGQTVQKTFIITMQRALLKGEQEINGRWIITDLKDQTTAGSTKTS